MRLQEDNQSRLGRSQQTKSTQQRRESVVPTPVTGRADSMTPGTVLGLQRTAGNQAVIQLRAREQRGPSGTSWLVQRDDTPQDNTTTADTTPATEDSGPSFDPEEAIGKLALGAEIIGGYSEDTSASGESSDSTGEGIDLQAYALQRQEGGGSSGKIDVGKLIEAIFETEPFKSFKKGLLDKAEKVWKDLSIGVKVPTVVVAGGGTLAGLAISYGRPGGIPPFGGGISTPPIKLYEKNGIKIEIKFSGKAGSGNWQGSAILQGRF